MPSGDYLYVGSARSGIEARVARHARLARTKLGKIHWHIDFVLVHSNCRFIRAQALPGAEECDVARSIARLKGAVAPVPGFGASDCRSGCPAHLFRISPLRTS